MPQTKIEKKFFRGKVDQSRPALALKIGKKPAVTKFQQFQQNIALWCRVMPQVTFSNPGLKVFGLFVLRDTIPVSGSFAVFNGGSDA